MCLHLFEARYTKVIGLQWVSMAEAHGRPDVANFCAPGSIVCSSWEGPQDGHHDCLSTADKRHRDPCLEDYQGQEMRDTPRLIVLSIMRHVLVAIGRVPVHSDPVAHAPQSQ